MSMKLHWGPNSPFVRKVMVTAHETGLAEQLTLVRSLVAMNKVNANVMRDNPLSKIPSLVTADGFRLFDSDVICEYLDGLHTGPKLIPSSGQLRWQVLQWNALGSGLLDALILWRNERMRPAGTQSIETLNAYGQKTLATINWIENDIELLSRSPFSLGHIAIGCMFGYMDLRFADLGWRNLAPASAQWFATFSERPSAQRTEALVADALLPATL